jgi:hypothetical protein
MDGVNYLVSPFGESEWVRNPRKAGAGQLCGKAKTEAFRATELPVAQRPPINRRLPQRRPPRRGPVLHSLPDPADHPVFRSASASCQPQTPDGG